MGPTSQEGNIPDVPLLDGFEKSAKFGWRPNPSITKFFKKSYEPAVQNVSNPNAANCNTIVGNKPMLSIWRSVYHCLTLQAQISFCKTLFLMSKTFRRPHQQQE